MGRERLLTPLLLQHFGVPEAQSLIHEVYQSNAAAGGDRRAGAMRADGVQRGRRGGDRHPARQPPTSWSRRA